MTDGPLVNEFQKMMVKEHIDLNDGGNVLHFPAKIFNWILQKHRKNREKKYKKK